MLTYKQQRMLRDASLMGRKMRRLDNFTVLRVCDITEPDKPEQFIENTLLDSGGSKKNQNCDTVESF